MLYKNKIFIALAFVLTLVVSSVSFLTTTEANGKGFDYNSRTFGKCFVCTLKDQNISGSVTISVLSASSQISSHAVRMTDVNGRYIWSDDNAMSAPKGKRTFYLGNDHKVYKIYIKGNGSGSGSASVTESDNVEIRVSW